ncbi:MAG: GntR family transcriptional regulator [Deltaproteobacteria bacterium]|nr:GntR family transcriptional regulator [Deltaproteobacteria bacterium]
MPLKKKDIFEELKLAIMQGIFKPRERLMERSLAAQFNTSRTPIREALRKLESLGFLRLIPNQGATVNDFSLEDIEALYQVRIPNEKLAAKLSCARISREEIKKLSAINQQFILAVQANDFLSMIAKDQEFHLTLIGLCGNPFLVKIAEDLRLRSYQFTFYFWKEKKYSQNSALMHKKILKALRNHDMGQIESLIESHLTRSKDRYLKYLSQIQGT